MDTYRWVVGACDWLDCYDRIEIGVERSRNEFLTKKLCHPVVALSLCRGSNSYLVTHSRAGGAHSRSLHSFLNRMNEQKQRYVTWSNLAAIFAIIISILNVLLSCGR